MHLFFYARGIEHQMMLWKSQMQNTFWKWKRTNLKTGKDETILIQGALRPTVLGAWEYVFPEECLSEVLAIMGLTVYGATGTIRSFSHSMRLSFLRKIFGAKKVPKKNFEEAKKIPTGMMWPDSMRGLSAKNAEGVSIHLIGIKKDIRRDFPEHGYYQEGL